MDIAETSGTSPLVRLAKVTEIEAIFLVRTSVVENYMSETELGTIGITREWLAMALTKGEAQAWCAEIEEKVVGFSLALFEEREISALFVLPEFENMGLGSQLLERAVSCLKGLSSEPIRLMTDRETSAYWFYRNRGWADLGYGSDTDILDGDIYMQYDLSGSEGEK